MIEPNLLSIAGQSAADEQERRPWRPSEGYRSHHPILRHLNAVIRFSHLYYVLFNGSSSRMVHQPGTEEPPLGLSGFDGARIRPSKSRPWLHRPTKC